MDWPLARVVACRAAESGLSAPGTVARAALTPGTAEIGRVLPPKPDTTGGGEPELDTTGGPEPAADEAGGGEPEPGGAEAGTEEPEGDKPGTADRAPGTEARPLAPLTGATEAPARTGPPGVPKLSDRTASAGLAHSVPGAGGGGSSYP